MIKQVKDFWNRTPCDSLYSNKEPGTWEYFSEIAQYRYKQIPQILDFADFSKWEGRKVLEIGCGIGTDTVQFAKAGALVTAIDLSEESLSLARKNCVIMAVSQRVDLYQVDLEDVVNSDFYHRDDHYYSLIYSFGVIHHTPNPSKAFSQIGLLCQPDTELRIMLYAKYSLHSLWVLLRKGRCRFWKLSELLRKHAESQYGCPAAYHYTFKEVRKLMNDYEISSIKKGYLSRLNKYIPKRLEKSLSKVLGGYIFVTAKLKFESSD